MKTIGISGRKGSGKTTVADFLLAELYDSGRYHVEIIGFSKAIKIKYVEMFAPDLKWYHLDLQENKDRIGSHGKTHRVGLQEFGIAMRKIDPDIWIREWYKLATDSFAELIIVPDVRFPNEVRKLHAINGHIPRLTSTPFPEDKHESETALDDMELHTGTDIVKPPRPHGTDVFDAIIDNANMSIDEQNKAVLELVTERKWI
jgi:hypothetical protein